MTFGESRVMFNQGGESSLAPRRAVDLYVYTDDLERHYARIKGLVELRVAISSARRRGLRVTT